MTKSLGSYTFMEKPTDAVDELQTVVTRLENDIDEQTRAEGLSATSYNGTRARRFVCKGLLITDGATTYLSKMNTLYGLATGGTQTFTDSDNIPDASNQVDVYIKSLQFGSATYSDKGTFVSLDLTLVEALE